MYIQVSKTFASFINETAKKAGFKASARLVWLPEGSYSLLTGGDIMDAIWDGDYSRDRQAVRAIVVEYPADYYAAPVYLTTTRLVREFRQRGVTDAAGLRAMVQDLCEI